ncbi:TIGR03862 family flavoprotein [Roseibacillus ishigakijimensis]|uniref:TIGR03862 family flavoprotein n=1 Tax=Roseibacillus ishigakijimensis TaxID=454146 RepID=A0A934VKT0_9BACT|nr:TIGR03862 family flavoprotein [Roseibacillus ishigakijimensis]
MVIVGGGPAGLRAAEVASAAGVRVTLYEGMRSVGRKFLIAGKGGFNMTHAEPLEKFQTRYRGPGQPEEFWPRALANFDNQAIRGWAARLGVGTFVASSGRVYPKALKAAPLLRAWLQRLREQGVEIVVNHRLVDLQSEGEGFLLTFEQAGERFEVRARAVILALGGASWPRTGSDGSWTGILQSRGLELTPLTAANCGWEVDWPREVLARHEGVALKNLVLRAGEEEARGELVMTRYGLEGGPIYKLGPALKAMAEPVLTIDFKPPFSEEKLVAKMESARRNFCAEAQVRWKLPEAVCDLLQAFQGPFESAPSLAKATKAFSLPLRAPRPVAEAISSAGGLRWSELDEDLMVKKLPGLFVAGEMIDWEAPTGGYLMQGCFASGTLAGLAAAAYCEGSESPPNS